MNKSPKNWHKATTKMIVDIVAILLVFISVIFLLSSRANSDAPSTPKTSDKKPLTIKQPKVLT